MEDSINSSTDPIENEVMLRRRELNAKTSHLVEARKSAEESIRRYRQEIDEILRRSYKKHQADSNPKEILAETRSSYARRKNRSNNHKSYATPPPFITSITLSKVLQTLIYGFFVGVILIYIRMKLPFMRKMLFGDSSVDCDPEHPGACKDLWLAVNVIFNELSRKTGHVICHRLPKENRLMSKAELRSFLSSKKFFKKNSLNDKIDDLIRLIMENPHWNIRTLNGFYSEVTNVDNANEVDYIFTDLPTKSFMCRAQLALFKITQHVVIGLLGILTLAMSLYAIRYYFHSRERFERDCFNMVDSIIDLLVKQRNLHAIDPKIPPYLAINHVHDTLISLQSRKKQENIWLQARNIISKCESRIREDTQLIDGEEYLVWKWLGPSPSFHSVEDSS